MTQFAEDMLAKSLISRADALDQIAGMLSCMPVRRKKRAYRDYLVAEMRQEALRGYRDFETAGREPS